MVASLLVFPASVVFTPLAIALPVAGRNGRSGRNGSRYRSGGPLDELVEFAAVEPHATAFRAVVDLDPLAIRHHQLRLVQWAQHESGRASCRERGGPYV